MGELEHPLWRAVAERDTSADGTFVYGVRSTRVCCRPSCPSRRPRPSGVLFFPSVETARLAGYRPCRRCRPERAFEGTPGSTGLIRACRAIAAAPDRRWTSERLARLAETSAPALRRVFRKVLGLSPGAYVAACRQQHFQSLLRKGHSVSAALYASGYASPSRVYGVSHGQITPAVYRRGCAGVPIEWATTRSPLGRLLVAATEKGLCFVAIGADDSELEVAVRAEYPRARLERSHSGRLRRLAALATAAASGQPITPRIPADVAGTAFQWLVWRTLTAIPAGQPLTYAQLARAIGRPRAVRAAARACATNPLALFVPCHRVVGSDGTLRGYRWGIGAKRTLLDVESGRS